MPATGASKSPSILAYLRDDEEVSATARIVREAMATPEILAATPGPVLAALPAGIIWDLHRASVSSLMAIAREMLEAGRSVPPIFGRVDLAEVSARHLIQLARLLPRLRLSTRGIDAFDGDMIDWLRRPDQPAAEHVIINRLATISRTSSVGLAIKAAVAAKRRVHVQEFSRAIGVPRRTIEGRLSGKSATRMWRLIGWSVSLHALWRLDVQQWSLEQTATSLHFGSAEALGSHLARHLGERPRALLAHRNFESILDRYYRRLASASDDGTGT